MRLINKLLENSLIVIILAILLLTLGIMHLFWAYKHPEKINSVSGDDNPIIAIPVAIGCILLSIEFISHKFFDFSIIKWIFGLG